MLHLHEDFHHSRRHEYCGGKTSMETHKGEKGMIAPDLLAILCCPETKEGLSVLPNEIVERLNQRIGKGEIKNKAGEIVTDLLDGGLLRQDRQIVYAVRDQIPIMLIEEGIVVEANDLISL